MSKLQYIIISTVLVLGVAAFGGWKYINHQDQLKEQEIAAQKAAQAQAAEQAQAEQAQAEQRVQEQAAQQKVTNQALLDKCISNVNNQTTQAIQQGTAAGVDTAPADLQAQQSFIAQCEAEYPQN